MRQVRGNIDWQRGWQLLPLLLISLIWSSTADASWDQSLYRQLGLAGKLDKQTFRQALNSYQ
ncbi:MAG: peptidase, partial [Aeromonas veronii]